MTITTSRKFLATSSPARDDLDLEALFAIEERLGERAIELLVRGPARSRPVVILRRQGRRVAHPSNEAN